VAIVSSDNRQLNSIDLCCSSVDFFKAKAAEKSTKTRAIFLLAAKTPPYNVYANPFYDYAGFGNNFSVDSSGGLATNVQNFEYCPQSAIHGMVFDPTETYLYSADMWTNRIWCHKKDGETGKLNLVGSVEAPKSGDHPRWVEIHPSGKVLYVLMEAGNTLEEYEVDPSTHLPTYAKKSYPLVPPCKFFALKFICNSHSDENLFLVRFVPSSS
jgi:carboxy-cis,cis-muconate cyclase